MNILHFSDFHLRPGRAGRRSFDILDHMIEAIEQIKNKKPIDLVVFSGDFVDKCGAGFGMPYANVLKEFKEKVIDRIVGVTGIPPYRFLMVCGNHEVDRSLIDDAEKSKQRCIKDETELENYMNHKDIEDRLSSTQVFRQFQKEYYEAFDGNDVEVETSPFQITLNFDVDKEKVGIVLLNSSWMCTGDDDRNHIALGDAQLTQSWLELKKKDCKYMFAVAHHHPNFLIDYDAYLVDKILNEHFDVYFCGHTHGHDSRFEETQNGSIFHSIAAGTLYNNLHEENTQYRNSFTLLEYNKDEDAMDVTPYFQKDDESFGLDLNYGNNGDGTWYFRREKKNVFQTLDCWISQYKVDYGIIGKDLLITKGKQLLDANNRKIMLTALSGLGKTRLLYDTFNDGQEHPNSFYVEVNSSNQQSVANELLEIVRRIDTSEGLVIIDNCTLKFYDEINRMVPPNIRLICVNNEFYDVRGENGLAIVEIEPSELKPYVSKFIEESVPLNETTASICKQIQRDVDGYPGFAYKMVEQYHEDGNISFHIVDKLIPKLTTFSDGYRQEQESVMMMLSLFQPFPRSKANKAAYDFIVMNDILSGLDGNYVQRQKVINQTLSRFENVLIDKYDNWLSVRPLPLAVILTERWFESIDEDLMDQLLYDFEQLNAANSTAYNLLVNNFAARIKYMQDNAVAYDMISHLNVGPSAPFANEKVVCSKMGSQLFLSMSEVNPAAVTDCLVDVLQDKDIQWLKENIVGEVRRNLVLTLEKLSFHSSTFHKAAMLLAKLALAENEDFSNNATGQFLQLFHVVLGGTEVDLVARLSLLNEMAGDEQLSNLTIRAINSAFTARGFVRMGGAEKFGEKKLKDFTPTNKQVWDYWFGCRDILLSFIAKHQYVDEIKDVVVKHGPQWIVDGYFFSILEPLVTAIRKVDSQDWPDLYKALDRFVRDRDLKRYDDEKKATIRTFIQSLRPSSFIFCLYEAQHAYWNREHRSSNALQLMEELYTPLAHRFVDDEIYSKDDEVIKLVEDNEFVGFTFTREFIKLMTDEQLLVLFSIFENIIREKGEDYHSAFIIQSCLEAKNRPVLQLFLDWLLANDYQKLFVSMSARCDDELHSRLHQLHELSLTGKLHIGFLPIYLSSVSVDNYKSLINLLKDLYQTFPDRIKEIVGCLLRFVFILDNAQDPNETKFVKHLLLEYPIDDTNPRMNFEYTQFVVTLLDKEHDKDFAVELNRKCINEFNKDFLHDNFEGIYSSLLLNYKDVIWDDFEKAFVSDDYKIFWFQIRNEVGSGFGFGEGPMFLGNEERIKAMCQKYPDEAPVKLAGIVPVFTKNVDEVNSFAPLFLWLLENFGDKKEVLQNLHANMHSFSWTGSPIGLYATMKRCLENINVALSPLVSSWVEKCKKELDQEIQAERSQDDYMKNEYM